MNQKLVFCGTFLLILVFMSIVDAEISSINSKEWDADNKTISIIDLDSKTKLMSVWLVSSVPDLTTFTEIFEISNYYAYQPDSKNDFRARTEVFQGNEDVTWVEWFIEQNVSYVVNVTDYGIEQVEKEKYNNKTGKNETVLVDMVVIVGYHDETRYKDVWVDYRPYDKVMSKDQVQKIKVVYHKVPELGPFLIQTVPVFRGVECFELTWWSGSWDRRKEINITTNGTSVPVNYEMQFNISFDSDMQVDFDDLRFVNSSGGELSHFIELKVDSSYALVWVSLSDAITDPGSDMIYMYYGNAGASDASDGNGVFGFFDDFPGSSIDTSKWDSVGTVTVSSGLAEFNTDTTAIQSKTSFSTDIILEGKISLASAAGYSWFGFADVSGFGNGQNEISIVNGGDQYIQTRLAGTWGTSFDSSEYTGYRKWKIIRKSTTNILFYIDDTILIQDRTVSLPVGSYSANFQRSASFLGLDYVFIRKYIANEPTYSIGVEETYGVWCGGVGILGCSTDVVLDNSVIVSWQTNNKSNSRMFYGQDAADTANFTNGNWSVWVYNQTNISIHQHGLSDNTVYFWAPYSETILGNASDDEFLLEFKTPVSSVPGSQSTLNLAETLLLIVFMGLLISKKEGWMLLTSGLFYSMWFYSTQLSHDGEYDMFSTAAFALVWVCFILRIYEMNAGNIQNIVKRRSKNK